MKSETHDSQPDAPTSTEPTASTQSESASQPNPKPDTVVQSRTEISRNRRFWRTSLIWLAVIALAFLVGILTYHFLRYNPLNESLSQTQNELAQTHQTNSDLQTEIDGLNTQLSTANNKVTSLESDKLALLSEVDDADAHLKLLRVLADVNNARLALVNGDIPAAKTVLQNASKPLESLAPRIATADPNLATSMPQRLALILSGMDTDLETAKVDLELLAKNLLDVEVLMFGK